MAFTNYRHKPLKRIYCGSGGGGKTTKCIADMLAADYDFVFVFDDDGQFAERIPAYPSTTREECVRAIANGSVCFNPGEMFEDAEDGFKWFSEWAFNFSCQVPGRKLLVFDELQVYLDPHPGNWRKNPFAKVCGKGRWRGLDIFCIAPTLNELNPKFRGQLTEIVAFYAEDAAFAQHVVSKGIPLAELQSLKDGEFLHWKKGVRGFTRGKVKLG